MDDTVRSRLHLRRARPADAESISRVHASSWQAGYADIFPPAYLESLDWHNRVPGWQRILTDPDTEYVLVATVADEVIGFAHCAPTTDSAETELHSLYVAPTSWRTGAASALLERAAADHCDQVLVVWVLEGNRRGRAFYDHHGFAADEARTQTSRGGVTVDVMRYRRAAR